MRLWRVKCPDAQCSFFWYIEHHQGEQWLQDKSGARKEGRPFAIGCQGFCDGTSRLLFFPWWWHVLSSFPTGDSNRQMLLFGGGPTSIVRTAYKVWVHSISGWGRWMWINHLSLLCSLCPGFSWSAVFQAQLNLDKEQIYSVLEGLELTLGFVLGMISHGPDDWPKWKCDWFILGYFPFLTCSCFLFSCCRNPRESISCPQSPLWRSSGPKHPFTGSFRLTTANPSACVHKSTSSALKLLTPNRKHFFLFKSQWRKIFYSRGMQTSMFGDYLALSLYFISNCVTLGRLLSFSEHQVPYLMGKKSYYA